jgi:beta-galactosidase
MSSRLTRRDFLSDTALVAAASALGVATPVTAGTTSSAQKTQSIATRRSNFDQQWRFFQGDPPDADKVTFADAAWRTLDLPHDWSIEGPFDEHAPAKGNGAYLPTGIGWYRKSFVLPSSARQKRIVLEFDGVYQRSEVWINGIPLGMHPYGFIGFSYDLTPHLAPLGRPNRIALRVDNSLQPNCRWYSGSGIYRHTWLRITDPVHIAQWGICVRTPSVNAQSAAIMVSTHLSNLGTHDTDLSLTSEILDPSGNVIHHGTTPHSLSKGSDAVVDQQFTIAAPSLWSPGTPHLYQARCTIQIGDTQIDQQTTTFGIRFVQFDVDRGFLLNGEHIKMKGVCIHGDGGSVGAAVPERIWERRLQLLQEMGCNAIRLSHTPPRRSGWIC